MNKSDSIKELAAAMSAAQSKIEGAVKDKANPFFKSKYADLASVVEAIRKPLADAGLSYTQVLHDAENAAKVETVIMHKSGEWLSCGSLSVPVSKVDAQGYGSALTYARRYSLSAAFGVAPEDDDGNAAAAAKPNGQSKVTGLPTAPISPVDGSLDALSPAERKEANHIASLIVDCFETGKEFTAYEAFYQSNLSNEMKLGIWEVLKPHSKIRNTLKKMDLETKVAQQA